MGKSVDLGNNLNHVIFNSFDDPELASWRLPHGAAEC
jgi:hypothetical protein